MYAAMTKDAAQHSIRTFYDAVTFNTAVAYGQSGMLDICRMIS